LKPQVFFDGIVFLKVDLPRKPKKILKIKNDIVPVKWSISREIKVQLDQLRCHSIVLIPTHYLSSFCPYWFFFLADVGGLQSEKKPQKRHQRTQIGRIGGATPTQNFILETLLGPLQFHDSKLFAQLFLCSLVLIIEF
jgi:hypothetical protein